MRSPFKSVEVGFRKLLLKSLRHVSRSRRKPPQALDYNQCKVLFIRQDRIGDVLVSTPIFFALKKAYPGIVIDVLLSSNNHFVLDHASYVRKRWVYTKNLLSSVTLLREIRNEKYDFVVDLMDNPSATSTVLLLFSGGAWNVGLEKENSYAYDIIVPMLSRRETHIIDRLAKLLTVFGVAETDLRVDYTTSPVSDQFVETIMRNGFKSKSRLIGINISAGHDSRFWGVENYREFLRLLKRTFGDSSIILLHKPEDRGRALEIVRDSREVLVPPSLSFDQFAAFIKKLSILFTPDTSAVHLAAAFQVPSVILYVQSDKALRIWEPYRTECETIVAERDLSSLDVSTVFLAFKRLMDRLPPRRASARSGMTQKV